jgi:plastocyanin
MWRTTWWIVVVFAAACGASQPAPTTKPAPTTGGAAGGAPGATQVTGRAPAGALVALEPAGGALPLPDGGALMDQYSKQFVPTTLFVRVGQPVTFRNSEDQLHDVTIVRSRTGSTVFNVSQDPFDVHHFTFDRPGEYEVNCDVHPGMRATIVASTTPYAVYADAAGRYVLSNVAPGAYTLQITSGGQVRERAVDVSGPGVEFSQ